jgi:hypothetical protein
MPFTPRRLVFDEFRSMMQVKLGGTGNNELLGIQLWVRTQEFLGIRAVPDCEQVASRNQSGACCGVIPRDEAGNRRYGKVSGSEQGERILIVIRRQTQNCVRLYQLKAFPKLI